MDSAEQNLEWCEVSCCSVGSVLHTFLWLHSLSVLLGSGDLLLCVFCATHLCPVLASLCKINGPCGVCVLLAL